MGLDGSDLSETWEDYAHSEETNDEIRCLIVASATHLEKAQASDLVETWKSLRIQLDGTLKKKGKHCQLSLNQVCFIIATKMTVKVLTTGYTKVTQYKLLQEFATHWIKGGKDMAVSIEMAKGNRDGDGAWFAHQLCALAQHYEKFGQLPPEL